MPILYSKYKIMLNLKRLTTKELKIIIDMAQAEYKERQFKDDNNKSMLEHGKINIKSFFKILFPKQKKRKK